MFISSLLVSSSTYATEITQSTSANASVNVAAACSISSSITSTHSATVTNGEYKTDIGNTNFTITCNDNGGYALYAIGYSNDIYGNTVMVSDLGNAYDIATGTGSSGTSKWAMKLTAGTNATIQNSFNNYHVVPTDYTKVAQYTPNTTGQYTATVSSTYSTYVSANQPAGTYVGKVKYTVVHPSTAPTPVPPLYDTIASMSKGTQSASDLKDVITVPTSNNPATDTSNSGVFLYDASLYGTASDASNDYPIYYYRGILDSDLDPDDNTKYGSNGNGAYYPNYVVLSSSGTPTSTDTCWRIVRTTGSGGIKMIFNGFYGTTNTGSCANSLGSVNTIYYDNNDQPVPFNASSATIAGETYAGLGNYNIHAIGYTYSNVAAETATATAISTLFGASGNDTTTNVNSSVAKQYIEDWYESNLSSYTSLLEPDAGFCNDRSAGQGTSWTTPLADNDTIVPYGTSGLGTTYFGSGIRNRINGDDKKPTLTCPRGAVDLYSTSAAAGGNKQLSYPIALLTIDETSLAGSGSSGRTAASNRSSNYSYSSYLRSGNSFMLLSPSLRGSGGGVIIGAIGANGNSQTAYIVDSATLGVRPVISLKHDVGAASGSGTATDPWVVVAP